MYIFISKETKRRRDSTVGGGAYFPVQTES